MTTKLLDGSAQAIAAAVKSGTVTAREVALETLSRIKTRNSALGAFTDVTAARALAKADAIDAARARGESLGPLAGAPFAVKNLFDIEGLTTRAGSKINRDRAPAQTDATAVARLEAAGAVLVGALNMGEYAYDFTGENTHDGPSRNPHDLEHMTGGSSGGSGAAVAGGLVPIALGTDTNGSIRVPSSFCGLFGFKPTYGRLSRAGVFPFVASLDHVGPLARSVGDLALSYDAMLGPDERDPAQADMPAAPASPTLNDGVAGLRIAKLGGYFARSADESALSALDTVARALKADRVVELAGADVARSTAYLISMVEGGALHLERLRARGLGISIPTFAIGSSPARCFPAPGLPRRKNSGVGFEAKRSRSFGTSISCLRRRPRVGRPGSGRRRLCSRAGRCWSGLTSGCSPNPYPLSACLWSWRRCGPMARSFRLASRSSPPRGEKISRCAWPQR